MKKSVQTVIAIVIVVATVVLIASIFYTKESIVMAGGETKPTPTATPPIDKDPKPLL